MLKAAVFALETFHKVMGVAKKQKLSREYDDYIWNVKFRVQRYAQYMENHTTDSDARFYQAHLMLEELSEVLEAMVKGDEVGLLDSLTDLIFVTVGAAVQFDLPISEAFEEIYKSNMTKTPGLGPRLRDKGEMYIPPDLAKILKEHRDVSDS